MNLGETIVTLRKHKSLLQRELAERIGMSANALCNIENNISFPTKETIEAICKGLEIPVSYLLFSCLTEDDIPEDRREVFNILRKPIMDIVMDSLNQ